MYPNLVKVFYYNMDISASHQNFILTNIYGVPIVFDVCDLNMILGARNEGLILYTSRKSFNSLISYMLRLLETYIGG